MPNPNYRIEDVQLKLGAVLQLELQASPENFWQDGEVPATAANRNEFARLSARLERAEAAARKALDGLTPADRQTCLNSVPASLREVAANLGFQREAA